MRAFHFKAEYNQLLTPEVVAYLTQIHEYKGQQNLFIEAEADTLQDVTKEQTNKAPPGSYPNSRPNAEQLPGSWNGSTTGTVSDNRPDYKRAASKAPGQHIHGGG